MISRMKAWPLLALVTLTCLSGMLWAAEDEHAAGEGHEEAHGRNHLGVFLGTTKEHGHYRNTFGFEYAYQLNERWAAGAVIERSEREKNSTARLAFVHFFPTESLYLGAGFGKKDPQGEQRNLTRLTIGYDFDIGGGWLLAPEANVDFITDEKNEGVFGVVLTKSF